MYMQHRQVLLGCITLRLLALLRLLLLQRHHFLSCELRPPRLIGADEAVVLLVHSAVLQLDVDCLVLYEILWLFPRDVNG